MKRLVLALAALLCASSAQAQTQNQFPTSPWSAFAPAQVECGKLLTLNMNTTADQAIPISIPSADYMIDSIVVSAPSVSLTTAAGGLYSAVSKGGVAVVAANQAYSALTNNTANTTGNALFLTIATAGNTTRLNVKTLYFSLTTAQGAAATAHIRVYCNPLY